MTKYNTGNPVGSADPRDLYDNAENLDNFVNGDQAAYNDRLGRPRRSWQSVEDQVNQQEAEFNSDQSRRENEFQAAQDDREGVFNAYLVSAGYQFAGDYASGIEITQYNQVVRDTSGEFWRLSGSVTLPYTTTGAGLPEGGAFVAVGDAALRQELTLPVSENNEAALVNGATIYAESVAELEALSLAEGVNVYLTQGGRAGEFVVKAGTPPSDPQKGIYVVLNNGNYAKRVYSGPIDVKWFGALGDGSTDDTVAIQAAIDFGSIVFPSGTYMVDGNDPAGPGGRQGVRVPSNRAISWLDGAEVRVIPNSNTGYNAFLVDQVENVLFLNPRIKGDRDEHTGVAGEFGMGIEIRSAENIVLRDPYIYNCWGDGIYIGQVSEAAGPCKDIYIERGKVDNNRRQGMSVISVDGLFVDNTQFTNTNGTPPQAGVDFEPNDSFNVLRRVRFTGVTTKNNQSAGLLFWLHNLDVAGLHVDMKFDNCYDEGSSRFVYFGSQLNSSGTGSIVFNSPVSKNGRDGAFAISNWNKDAPRVIFNNPVAINATTDSTSLSEAENSGFSAFTTSDFTGVLGGFEVHDYKSENDGTVPTYAPFPLRFAETQNVKVSGTSIAGGNIGIRFASRPGNELTDIPKRILSLWPGTTPVSLTLPSVTPYTEVWNDPTKRCELDLPPINGTSQYSIKVTYVGGPNNFLIRPPSGQSLRSGGLFSTGMQLAVADRSIGASAILRVVNDEWHVDSYVGNWTAI